MAGTTFELFGISGGSFLGIDVVITVVFVGVIGMVSVVGSGTIVSIFLGRVLVGDFGVVGVDVPFSIAVVAKFESR